MTCIAAIKDGKTIWMGGDSMVSTGDLAEISAHPKVWKTGEFLIGSSGDVRFGQLLRHAFRPPAIPDDMPLEEYMTNYFVRILGEVMDMNGCVTTHDGRPYFPGSCLVGVRSRLFNVTGWSSWVEIPIPFVSIGSGAEIALGSLSVLTVLEKTKIDPKGCLEIALVASETMTKSVRGPFTILSLEENEGRQTSPPEEPAPPKQSIWSRLVKRALPTTKTS